MQQAYSITETGNKHHLPHIHAECREEKAYIFFDGEILAGKMRADGLHMVQAWIHIHQILKRMRLFGAGHLQRRENDQIVSGSNVFLVEPLLQIRDFKNGIDEIRNGSEIDFGSNP